MRTIERIAVAASIISLVIVCMFSGTGMAAAAPIKVGVIAPLSGRVALVGQALRNSIVLETEESQDKQALEFIFEDDEYLPKNSLSAAKKLIEVDKVDALIVFGTGPATVVAESAFAKKVPLIAMAMSGDLVEKYKNVFRVFLSSEQQVNIISSEIKRRGYSSIGVLRAALEVTQVAHDLLVKDKPASIILDEEVLPAEMDLRVLVTKVKRANPAAVMLMLYPPQIAIAAKGLRAEGYKGEFFGLSFMLNPQEIKAADGAMDGAWAVAIDGNKATAFVERYKARFAVDIWHDGGIGYDIAHLLRQAVSQPKGIADYLEKTSSFEGVYGTYRQARARDFEAPAVVQVVNR